MLDPKQFDEMAKRFADNLPTGVRDLQQEVEKNARVALQSAFNRMELVTREEFDAQAKVLARTRERLEALEARLAALESGSAGPEASSGDDTASA